jgi:hypothetical protein
MVKRVTCKIIDSVPLGKSTYTSRHFDGSIHRFFGAGDFVCADTSAEHFSNASSRISSLDPTGQLVPDIPAGAIIDYYA